MNSNKFNPGKPYTTPKLISLKIDHDISLVLQSDSTTPIWGPDENIDKI